MKKSLIMLFSAVFVLGGISLAENYTSEQESAYDYAYSQKITTASSIENADMNGELTRIAMAKMISNFAINVLGLQPDISLNCSFGDVVSSLDEQYNYGVTQACQLGLMGIGKDGKKSENFDPNATVTRAQFATAFSRALSKFNGNIIEDGDPYYSTHLQYLQSEGIIKSVTSPFPSTAEKRGNVMIMMMRASDFNKNADVEIEIIPEDDQSQKLSAEIIAKLKDKGVVRGSEDAKITIIEFTELLCPYCQRHSQQGIINSVIQQFSGQVNSISRSFIIHGDIALQLSSALECVGELNSGVYYDVLDESFGAYPVNLTGLVNIAMEHGVDEKLLQNCISEGKHIQSIVDMMNIGLQLGVNGTPGSIIINNESGKYVIVAGAYPVETFVEAVESLLNLFCCIDKFTLSS